jgi:hypothetical protein
MDSERTLYSHPARLQISASSGRAVLCSSRVAERNGEYEKVKTKLRSYLWRPGFSVFASCAGLMLSAGTMQMQAQKQTLQTAVENTQTGQDLKIQQLEDRLEEIQKELIQLKRSNMAPPTEPHLTTTAKASAPPETHVQAEPEITDPSNPHSEPFAFADFTWLNGNPRTKDTPYATKYFTPEYRSDVSYTYDFRHPQDDTIVGSSEVFRSSEVTLTDLGIGGDFHWENVHARVLTQIGLYATATPRNDASPARGQWDLADAYRYVGEANAGYHFNVQHGLNVDAGIFLSYVGLFSFYQFDNWAYQPSYVSSNTPWFFNGVRVQWYPTAKLKIEPWFINGWQSYGRFNNRPGLGGQILWRPSGKLEILGNQYGYGEDALGIPSRTRYHTDDSIQYKYYDRPLYGQSRVHSYGRRRLRERRRRKLLWQHQAGTKAEFPRIHGLQPPLVRSRSLRRDGRRRTHQQPRPLPRPAAAHQRSDRSIRHTVLHRESRGSLQGMGYFVYLRLHAQPILHLPARVQSSRIECSLLRWTRWRNAARRKYRRARFVGARLES